MQQRVPHAVALLGIAGDVVQADLLQDACFTHVGNLVVAVCTADVNTTLARGVTTKHRTIVHENHTYTMPCSGDRSDKTSHTSSYHAEICLKRNMWEFFR